MLTLRSLLAVSALLLTPALVEGQLPVSTGSQVSGTGINTRDTRWQIGIASGSVVPTTFVDAWRIQSPVWTQPGGASWIGAEGQSGSLPGAVGDGSRRYTYAARTSFSLNAGDLLTIRMQCTFDNYWLGFFINGTQFGSNVCGNDLTYTLASEFTIGPASFFAGMNTLEFRWQGDGVTDGFIARINSALIEPGVPGVVPEPSTYVLMATGLVGVIGASRRRRSS